MRKAYIHREPDPDYYGHHLYVPRDKHGNQVADESPDNDIAHDNANREGYMYTEDAKS